MKKILSVILSILIVLSVGAAAFADGTEVRIGALKGPTSMGLVKLLDDAENGLSANEYEFTMAGSADEITPKFLKGELDIIAAPANLGAVLNSKSGGAVRMAAINTLGVVYIVEKGGSGITDVASLKGRTIYATGKGSAPEYALSYILSGNGLDISKDVTVEWKSEPTEVVALMATEDHSVAMLPQPYVTVASAQLEGLRIALDLTAEWDALGTDSRLITAGIFVRRDFAENNPAAVKAFLDEYAASASYVNENVKEASVLIEKYGIVKAAIAEKAVPFCNIVSITGNDMVAAADGYFRVLYDFNPASVGEKLPENDFYLIYE